MIANCTKSVCFRSIYSLKSLKQWYNFLKFFEVSFKEMTKHVQHLSGFGGLERIRG